MVIADTKITFLKNQRSESEIGLLEASRIGLKLSDSEGIDRKLKIEKAFRFWNSLTNRLIYKLLYQKRWKKNFQGQNFVFEKVFQIASKCMRMLPNDTSDTPKRLGTFRWPYIKHTSILRKSKKIIFLIFFKFSR